MKYVKSFMEIFLKTTTGNSKNDFYKFAISLVPTTEIGRLRETFEARRSRPATSTGFNYSPLYIMLYCL